MNVSDPVEVAEVARARAAAHDVEINEKMDHKLSLAPSIEEVPPSSKEMGVSSAVYDDDHAHLQRQLPSDEEFKHLRRVAGDIPWTAYTVAFVELCERFSYYGTTAVCMSSHSSH
jgi:POT family proton-dependent oligopeptide transporter